MSTTLEKLKRFGRLIKIEHTLFALPFSAGSLILASRGMPSGQTALWVLVCIVSGRSFAMAANRVIDRHVDAVNPRTANRELPAGLLGLREVLVFMAATLAMLIYAVWQLPVLCRQLLPIAMALLIGYSYMKFLTPLCHVVLGITLATPVLGARIAVTGVWEWNSLWMGLGVLLWVCGFDIMYACQDVDFDRGAGLHSIPAQLGTEKSLRLSMVLHLGVVPALALFGYGLGFPVVYYAGLSVMLAVLAWEHWICRGASLARINDAFFHANVIVSVLFLLTCIATVVWDARP